MLFNCLHTVLTLLMNVCNIFYKIKYKVCVINCKVFMTDDAPSFFNARVAVTGSVKHRLLCTLHFDKNCRKNVCKISGRSEKKNTFLQYIKNSITNNINRRILETF